MKPFLLALLIGAASAFAFAPVGLWPLMPLALAALCELVWRSKSLKQSLAVGWGFGLGQFVVGLNWIATAFTYQAAMPAWLGWVAVVLLSLYLAVYPALAAGLAWRFKGEERAALLLALAGAWPLTEYLRGTMFTGFPWNPISAAGVDVTRLLVPTIGTYGASAAVVALGGCLWMMARKNPIPLIAYLPVALPLILFGGAASWGPSDANGQIRVVQPNIGQEDKWRDGFSEEAARRLAVLSMKPAGQRPRLLLWPEAAITDPLEDARTDEHQALAQFERTRAAALVGPGEYLLTGGLAVFSKDGHWVDGAANSIFVLGQGGRVVGRYDKAHLVPYGEYLPMRPVLSAIGLSRLAPGDIDFASGPGPRTIDLGDPWGKVGFQLCYEIIFSGQVVDRRNRPDFIFNPSNDAWFGRWGPPQHLAQAQLRAAEEGIPVIRSTPTGISAVIGASGKVETALPWRTAGVIDDRLPLSARPTLFARFGNIIPLLLGFALLLSGIVLGRTRR